MSRGGVRVSFVCYSGPVIPQRAAREPFNFDRACRVGGGGGGDGDDGFMMDGPGARVSCRRGGDGRRTKDPDRGSVRGQSIKKKKKNKPSASARI